MGCHPLKLPFDSRPTSMDSRNCPFIRPPTGGPHPPDLPLADQESLSGVYDLGVVLRNMRSLDEAKKMHFEFCTVLFQNQSFSSHFFVPKKFARLILMR